MMRKELDKHKHEINMSSTAETLKDAKFFTDRLRKSVPDVREEPYSRLFLVATVIDTIIFQKRQDMKGVRNHFAVVKNDPESSSDPLVLYVITAPDKELAFCIMCLDACRERGDSGQDGTDSESEFDFDEEELMAKDPDYRTLDIVEILKDVGERAEWDVTRVWKSFMSFCDSGDMEPYSIINALERICGFADLE